MFLVFLLIFFIGNGIHQTDGQSDNFFSSWKEPPINSGIGEGNATVTVRENNQVGTSTGIKLQVLGGTGKISYILNQSNPLYFRIGGANKDEITTAIPSDFEMLDRITVTVVAFDEGNPQKTGSAIMTIFIGDVNEHAPTFLREVYEVTISPLFDTGIAFARLHAADGDGSSPNNNVVYSIEGGNTNDAFMIDSKTGNIAMAKQLYGYDITPQYELIILGVDGGTDPSPLTGTTTMLVKIVDVETFSSWKEPPVNSGIGSGTASVKVKENSEKGTNTNIKLRALDGWQRNIIYKIKSDHQTFSIGGPNGNALIVEEPIDFEVVSNISILVEAQDSSINPKNGRVNMTILIEDINDNTPVFEKSNYKAVVSESSPIGFTLATVKATDSDGTFPNNEVVYTFTGGNTNDAFRIDSTTGNIAIAKQLDGYNITPQYELIILGVDGGTDPSPLTGTTTMLVKIFDVETFSSWKEPPVNSGIGSGTASLKVEENAEVGTITDIKLHVLGGNGNITYKIASEQKTFSIGGPNGNTLIVEEPIDFEVVSNISILVEAKDSSITPKIGRVNMTLLIEDINDNAPVFEKSNYKTVVFASSPVGFTLATVKATDSDGTFPNNEVVYTFTGGNTFDAFVIDSKTGNIAMAKQLYGYDITQQYELIILGVDGGTDPSPLTGTTTMLVKIFDETSLTTTMSAEIVTQQETHVQRDHIFTIGYFSGFGSCAAIVVFAVLFYLIRRRYLARKKLKDSKPGVEIPTYYNTRIDFGAVNAESADVTNNYESLSNTRTMDNVYNDLRTTLS